jgi:predicted ATP-grasp superfamily ATP-dependent carboligase
MKVLLAEYTVFNDPVLAPEGEAMLRELSHSFKRCGFDVISPEGENFEKELNRLAPTCDLGLVIAPDHLMARYTKIIEDHTHNIGCGSLNCAICANKQRTAKILANNGIAVPKETSQGLLVIKEIYGCGAQNMRLSREKFGNGEFGQEYIEGDHLSVSLVGSRVVGEACLHYSGAKPLFLSLNRQFIEINDGLFSYHGGETPADHPRGDDIIDIARKTVEILGCQGYVGVDVVVADDIYVVDVNPRITSSINGITAIMREEIADILVSASFGKAPDEIHLSGHVTFDKDGRVHSV